MQVGKKTCVFPLYQCYTLLLESVLTLGLLHTLSAAVALYTNIAISLQSRQLLVVSQLANIQGHGTLKMVLRYLESCYSENPLRRAKSQLGIRQFAVHKRNRSGSMQLARISTHLKCLACQSRILEVHGNYCPEEKVRPGH